jgi:adenine-specific DNA-methyltransferase
MTNKIKLAQWYTKSEQVDLMLSLSKRTGAVLEPSSGAGNIFYKIKDRKVTALELDEETAHEEAEIIDFFAYDTSNKFDSIIMNPPYLKFRDIPEGTKKLPEFIKSTRLIKSGNLYAYFIEKAIKHLTANGEIIALIPSDWVNSTSGIALRSYMDCIGNVTDCIDLSGKKIFDGCSPDTHIMRFTLDKNEHRELKLECNNYIRNFIHGIPLMYYANIHVGCVQKRKRYSPIFGSAHIELVTSKTRLTGKTDYVNLNQDWIRQPNGIEAKIFVNCKTRRTNPFFTLGKSYQFDGGVLGIIPKFGVNTYDLLDKLNNADWENQFMFSGGRYQFSQRNLREALI